MNLLQNWGVVALASVAVWVSPVRAADEVAKPVTENVIPDSAKISGFAAGCQAYSFKAFSAYEAIKLTHEAGGKCIELYPGQNVKPGDKTKLDHHASDEVLAGVKEELKKNDVIAVNYGVVGPGGKTADDRKKEWREIFIFAKKMNLYGVTSEPAAEDMDEIEKLVKEFDIHFSIHDHPIQNRNLRYEFWDPYYVWRLVKDRDPRMGACADTGHWLASGVDPIMALHILKGRIISSHLKDRNVKGPKHHDVAWGKGVGDVKGILDELKAQGFNGNISIEYEDDMEPNADHTATKSYPAIKESFEYIQHYGQTASR